MFSALSLLFHTFIQTEQCLCLLPVPEACHFPHPLLSLSAETQSCTAYLITDSIPVLQIAQVSPVGPQLKLSSWSSTAFVVAASTFIGILFCRTMGCSSRLSGNVRNREPSHPGSPVLFPSREQSAESIAEAQHSDSAHQLASEWGFNLGITPAVLVNTGLTTVLALPLAWQVAATSQGGQQTGMCSR